MRYLKTNLHFLLFYVLTLKLRLHQIIVKFKYRLNFKQLALVFNLFKCSQPF